MVGVRGKKKEKSVKKLDGGPDSGIESSHT